MGLILAGWSSLFENHIVRRIVIFVLGSALILTQSRAAIAFLLIIGGAPYFFANPKSLVKKLPLAFILLMVLFLTQSRILDWDLHISTIAARLSYYIDAFILLSKNWLLGIGPDNWQWKQHEVQSTLYFVRDVHSGLLKVLLDGGIFSLPLIIVFSYISIENCFSSKLQTKFVGLAAAYGLVHSFIDLNFTFPAFLLILGLILGAVFEPKKILIPGRTKFIAPVFIALVLFGTWVATSEFFFKMGQVNIIHARFLTDFNPLYSENFDNLGLEALNRGEETGELKHFSLALKYFNKASLLNSQDPIPVKIMGEMMFKLKLFEESTSYLERLIVLQPLHRANYEALALTLFKAGEKMESEGNSTKAIYYFKRLATLSERISVVEKRQISKFDYIEAQAPKYLSKSPIIAKLVKDAETRLHRYNI